MTDTEWAQKLSGLNLPNIDERIAFLKDRITISQKEIVVLTVFRKGVERAEEFHAISKSRAEQAINEAIEEVNRGGPEQIKLKFTAEGGIK